VGLRSSGSRIARMTVMTGVLIAALAPASSAIPVTSRAESASACAHESVNGGRYVGPLTLRFGLVGHVSCATARRLARSYFHKVATGQCGQLNNFCDLEVDGWSCSIFFATESQETGGAAAGCAEAHGGAKVRFYRLGGEGQSAETVRTVADRQASLAAEHFRNCGNLKALGVHIQVYGVSCAMSQQILRAYLHHEDPGGVIQRVKGFPAWRCSTGDGSGSCNKGKLGSGTPEIDFFYLAAPRRVSR
jgi:hypothetical protein